MEHEKLTSLNQDLPGGAISGFAAVDEVSTFTLTSALLDGELQGEEFARACADLASDAQARQRWHDYHLVGETLRLGADGARMASTRSRMSDELFLARLRTQLAQETVPVSLVAAGNSPGPGKRWFARQGANDAYGAWRITAGVCALVMVSLLGWQGVVGLQSASQARQLAQSRLDQRPSAWADAGRQVMPQQSAVPVLAASSATARPFASTQVPGQDSPLLMLRSPHLDRLMAQQNDRNARARTAPDRRYHSRRLGRAGVAAQGVLVNLEKSPALSR
jgi:negative regulator of sigma E activity